MKRGFCINFQANNCRFGNTCKFLHEIQLKKEEEQPDDRIKYMNQLIMQFEKKCTGCDKIRLPTVLSCGCECYCAECAKGKTVCPQDHEVTGFIE